MKIIDVVLSKSYTGFYFDDQKAIKQGNAKVNGFFYEGTPLTEGFESIRVAGEAVSIQLVLENGLIALGDCVAVQYSGAGGRDPLFLADEYIPFIEKHLKPILIGEELSSFKPLALKYDNLKVEGKKLHTAIRYGVTQALLNAVAITNAKSPAQVIIDEYNLSNDNLVTPVIFTQSGDNRYENADKMILKQVDSLPHALINNVNEKLGKNGEILADYLKWLKNRIIEKRASDDYNPIIHVDVYGTVGEAFNNDLDKMVNYLSELAKIVNPFKLRIEGPIDLGSRDLTMNTLKEMRVALDSKSIPVELVVDEWCNNLDDIKYFADNNAGHVIQIKSPDLGGLNNIVEAILYCKNKGIGAYVGGSCNETHTSAAMTAQLALATQADVILARPGMGVDEGYMIVKNEMERTLALLNRNK